MWSNLHLCKLVNGLKLSVFSALSSALSLRGLVFIHFNGALCGKRCNNLRSSFLLSCVMLYLLCPFALAAAWRMECLPVEASRWLQRVGSAFFQWPGTWYVVVVCLVLCVGKGCRSRQWRTMPSKHLGGLGLGSGHSSSKRQTYHWGMIAFISSSAQHGVKTVILSVV